MACAASDAHTNAHRLSTPLSVEYLFWHAAQFMSTKDGSVGLSFDALARALADSGQPAESDWPYQSTDPSPWVVPSVGTRWYGVAVEKLGPTAALVQELRNERPVVLGVALRDGFYTVAQPEYVIGGHGAQRGGHAVLVVGTGRSSSATMEDMLLIRNSWGFGWGFGGHAWLPAEYLEDNLIGYRVVEPHPTSPMEAV